MTTPTPTDLPEALRCAVEQQMAAAYQAGLNGEDYSMFHGKRAIAAALSAAAPAAPADDTHAFKNFHRSLCDRFGYAHDEKDWRRDQVSLIEHIAKMTAPQAQQPTAPQAGAESYEHQHAVMEAHRNAKAEEYFKARHEMLDTIAHRRIFEAGFERGWDERAAAALRARGAVPDGWKLVPLRVNNNMIDAANDTPTGIGGCPPHWQHVWDQMLGAAPEYKGVQE